MLCKVVMRTNFYFSKANNNRPISITFAGSYLILAVVFWGFNAFLICADYFGWPKWMAKYKVQPGQNAPVRIV